MKETTETVTVDVPTLRALIQRDNTLSLWVNLPWTSDASFQRAVRVQVVRELPIPVFRFEYLEDNRYVRSVDVTLNEVFDFLPRLAALMDRLEGKASDG